MNSFPVDRLVILMVSDSQSASLIRQLSADNFRFTLVNSTGGFLGEARVCILVGFSHERMPLFLDIVKTNCHSFQKFVPTQGLMPVESASVPMLEAQAGGATIFMMNVVRFEQI